MGPNVLLLVLDAARRDAFEPYGAPAGATPTVAQLAARGAAVEEVYATAPWTVPSHASMFTGLLPRAAGLARIPSPGAAKSLLEPHAPRFLPEVLRRRGYATAIATANPWASELSGFGTGFEQRSLVDSERRAPFEGGGRRGRARWLAEVVRGRADDGARAVGRTLERALADSAGRPFFWFVNLVEAHFPYLPPRGHGRVSLLDRARAARDAPRHFTLDSIYRVNARMDAMPADVLARARRLHRAAVAYLDAWLAGLLEHLDAAGVLDETLVIVTSDHGENFGEGGMVGHMLSLDQRLIHVPFVVAGPGAERVRPTSLAELPRCVADALGIDEHPWHDGPPAGIGVAQSDPLGEADDPGTVKALDDAGVTDEEGRARLTTRLSCAVRGGLKVLRRGETDEVYDLARDPLELEPLAPAAVDPARAAEVAELRAALDHRSMAVARPAAAPLDARPAGADEAEMRDLEERMKLLGYM